ncbi:MAG TPA: dienelactone hydrolase family protein [Opitutaceae bacterium]
MPTLADTLQLGAPLPKARGAVILIHGRGSSAADVAGLTETLDGPDIAYLAPSAKGGAWYPQRFFVPLADNEPWLSHALATVETLVADITAAGVPAERIGLVGFSQGACLALEHTARAGRRYGFTAALSGALIGPLATERAAHDLGRTPVLLGCAEHDAHIPLEFVERSAEVLRGMKADVTKQIYRGNAHTVFPQEIAWINAQLAKLRA